MRKKLFATISYKDSESTGVRKNPDFVTESQRFRKQLRSTNFLNPAIDNDIFESLDRNNKLSSAMKSFSSSAQVLRIKYIEEKLTSNKLSRIIRPIPVTVTEEESQLTESSLTNREIILMIQSLVSSLDESVRPQIKSLNTKKKDDLLLILHQVQNLHNNSEVSISEIEDTIEA